MAGTQEYQALIRLVTELRTAVQRDLIALSGRLLSRGLISTDNDNFLRDELRTKESRAAELVSIVLDKVKLNPKPNFAIFFNILKESGDHYNDLIKLIESEMPSSKQPMNSQSTLDHPVTDHQSAVLLSLSGTQTHHIANSSRTLEVAGECCVCTNELGCPEPLTTEIRFPYLDPESIVMLDDREKHDLEFRLERETKNIMLSFHLLVSELYKTTVENGVSIGDLKFHLKAIKALLNSTKECHIFEEYNDKLLAASDALAIFDIITQFCSFVDYSLLEHLIRILGSEADKKRMMDYHTKFNEYAKRRIIECPLSIKLADNLKWSTMYIKIDSKLENLTINQFQEFRFKVSEVLKVNVSAIRFCCAHSGCIQFTCQIPNFVRKAIFPLSSDQEISLELLGVIWFSCAGYEYSAQEMALSLNSSAEGYLQKDPIENIGNKPGSASATLMDTESRAKRIKLDEQLERESAAIVRTPTVVPFPKSSATQFRVQDTTLSPIMLLQGQRPYPDLPGGGPSFIPSHAVPPQWPWGHSYHHPTDTQSFIAQGAGTSGSSMPQRTVVSVHNLSMPLQSVTFTSPPWMGTGQQYNRELVTTTYTPALTMPWASSSIFQGCYDTSSQATNETSTLAHQSHIPGIPVVETAGEFQSQHTGKNTAEYQTIKKCTPQLITALKHNLTELSGHFLSKGLITSDQGGELRNQMYPESDRAARLIDFILNKVELARECYNKFIKVLEEDKHTNEVVLKLLKNTYKPLIPGGLLCSSVIAETTSLPATAKLNEYLMSNLYTENNCSSIFSDKFPFLSNFKKKTISLALIKREGISRATADEFTKGTLHGHPDEILHKKEPIELEAILEPPEGQQNLKCVFVEGAPGVGKSTLALELCRRQKEIKAMEKYSLILLLQLRDKQVQAIQTIEDVFKLFHNDPVLQHSVAKETMSSNGKNVLFILDGFDELPTNLRKYSFFAKLIQGIHLPACTVLVTSRPSASADLQGCIKEYKHIEVLGFTREQIEDYVKTRLCDQPEMLTDFLKYISNPPVRGVMYIPLNCAIILEIYETKRIATGKPIPRTMTQLYTDLCLILIKKKLKERDHLLADQVDNAITLDDLPDSIKNRLVILGKVAFEGALHQEITFDRLPTGCDDLGFINVSTGLPLGRISYSFLHLTLQEFLAAYYFSKLPPNEQKLTFICNSRLLTEDGSAREKNKSHLDVMWTFVAGLTGFKHIGWKLVHKATNMGANLFITCCLYEVQNEKEIKDACDNMFHEQTPVITVKTLLHSYFAGYCIAVSGRSWVFNVTYPGLGDEAVEMLGTGLKSANDICGSISSLQLGFSRSTKKAISHLSDLPIKILGQIKCINLYGNKLDKSAFDQLSNIVPHPVNLYALYLGRHDPGGDGAMIKLFQKLTQLRVLHISEITFGLSDVQALSQLLQSTKCLMELEIGDPYMSEESVSLMVEVLLSPSSLYRVILSSIQWTSKNVANFALLENNKNIAILHFDVFHEEFEDDPRSLNPVIPAVAKALHKNDTLVHLGVPPCEKPHIHNFDIEHESVVALSEMLEVNKTLEHLDVFTFLTCHDIQVLVNALEENYTLEQLHLRNERIEISNPD